MSRKTRCWYDPLLAGVLIVFLALAGCSGDDGKDGEPGPEGPEGPAGPAGPEGPAGEDGKDTADLEGIVPLNLELDLSNTVDFDAATGTLTVHFFLTDEDGDGVDVTTERYLDDGGYELRFYVAELIDNDDGTAGQSWSGLINRESGYPASADPDDALEGTLTLVDAATGEYTYEFANTLAASDNVHRVTVRARWRETIDGGRVTFANPVNTSYDFLQSDPGTELASSGADMVLTANCETCHGARIGDVGHGGGYTEVRTCNHCHNVNYMADRNGGEGDLAFMIHRIHDAGTFDQLEGGADFSEVTYPQHIYTCAKCHGGAPEANLAFEVPTRTNCGACHADVDFATGTNHDGGAQPDDSECMVCHKSDGLVPIEAAHDPEYFEDPDTLLANTSEYAVTIEMTPPANGEYYEAGEQPLVTVTLVSNDDPPVTVTYEADAEEGTTDGALASANLYVYGPRSEAVPVLATGSTTDPAWDPIADPTPQQGHSLLLTTGVSDDPQVLTDAEGYKYQLMDNIADLQPGTYMVRFEGEDYGAFSDADYRTASSAVMTFQVGTADEEHKVAGDACTNCHGATIMHLEGAHPHHQPFDTDGCLGCHDKSGNYADYIGNRVHAVHSASISGDLHFSGGLPRNWSEVTFPQDVNNCTICHTDTETETPVWQSRPDLVPCGGCHGAWADGDPALFPPETDQAQVLWEIANAQHMRDMGGDDDPTTPPTYGCLTCHGEGGIAYPYDTHRLILYGVSDP